MLSEEELVQCLQSVAKPVDEPPSRSPDLYPFQCEQKLLKAIVKESVKNPEVKKNPAVKYVLEQIKARKKIREGNACLQRLVDSFSK